MSPLVDWAAGGVPGGLRTVVLVEGVSDQAAVEALAVRLGRDLAAEGVRVVPIGGAMSIRRYLNFFTEQAPRLRLRGLCDAREEPYFRAVLQPYAYNVCVEDLEDELIGALGPARVEQVIEACGDLRKLRTFQSQPAQRGRTDRQQLRRFMGTTSGRKAGYAHALVQALDLARVPEPLDRLLVHL